MFVFRQRGRKGERGKKHQCVVACHEPPSGDLTPNPGMCPHWESNRRPSLFRHSIHWSTPGLWTIFLIVFFQMLFIQFLVTSHQPEQGSWCTYRCCNTSRIASLSARYLPQLQLKLGQGSFSGCRPYKLLYLFDPSVISKNSVWRAKYHFHIGLKKTNKKRITTINKILKSILSKKKKKPSTFCWCRNSGGHCGRDVVIHVL